MLADEIRVVNLLKRMAQSAQVRKEDINFLLTFQITPIVKQELCDEFQYINEIPNTEWMVILFVHFSYIREIFIYWPHLIEIKLHPDCVVEQLLLDCFSSSKTSWLSSTILTDQKLNKYLQFSIIEKFSEIEGSFLIDQSIIENQDFTTLVNVIRLASQLKILRIPNESIIQYIKGKNSEFKNLFPLESLKSPDIPELSDSLANGKLFLIQITSNVLILWESDVLNSKLNLNSLTEYTLVFNSIKLSFEQEGNGFNIMGEELNKLTLLVSFDDINLMSFFLNKLKLLESFKPQKISVSAIPAKLSTAPSLEMQKESHSFEEGSRQGDLNKILKLISPERLNQTLDEAGTSYGKQKLNTRRSFWLMSEENTIAELEEEHHDSASIQVPELPQGSQADQKPIQIRQPSVLSLDSHNTSEETNSDQDEISIQVQAKDTHDRTTESSNPIKVSRRNKAIAEVPSKSYRQTPPLDEGTGISNSLPPGYQSKLVPRTGNSTSSETNGRLPGNSEFIQDWSRSNQLFSQAAHTTAIDNSRYDAISSSMSNFSSTLIGKMRTLELEVLEYHQQLTNDLNENIKRILEQHHNNIQRLNQFLEAKQQELFRIPEK